jgi:hypothetical protein
MNFLLTSQSLTHSAQLFYQASFICQPFQKYDSQKIRLSLVIVWIYRTKGLFFASLIPSFQTESLGLLSPNWVGEALASMLKGD